MKIYAVTRKSRDPITGDNIIGRRQHYVHESAAKYKALQMNKKMKDFQKKFNDFWNTYLPDKDIKDEENIKRLFGLVRPIIKVKPDYNDVEKKPLRPFKVNGKKEQEEFDTLKKEWEDKEKQYLLRWMKEHGERFYKEDDEYWSKRQKCIDKLCKEITGMTFFQLNQGDQYEEYRFADEYSYKEIFVDEKK